MSELDYFTLWEQPVFAVLSPTQRQWLEERISVETIPARSSIYHSSDPSEHLYFILSGKVKVEATSPSGSRLIKRICLNGDFFGSKGLFEEATFMEHAATLRSAVHFVKIKNRDLRRLAEVNYPFAEKLMGMLREELLFLEERTAILTELSARERFAKFLLEMVQREGEREGVEEDAAWVFNSQLTQAEIGAYIGTGRQTVTEILNEFREQGVLRYVWGRFYVRDLKSLS